MSTPTPTFEIKDNGNMVVDTANTKSYWLPSIDVEIEQLEAQIAREQAMATTAADNSAARIAADQTKLAEYQAAKAFAAAQA